MTLTVPCNSAQRGGSAAGSESAPFTGIALSSGAGFGAGGSVSCGLAGAVEPDVGGGGPLSGEAGDGAVAGAGPAPGAGRAAGAVTAGGSALATAFGAGDGSVTTGLGGPGDSTASGAAGAAAAAGALTWGMRASASAAASPEPRAIAAISCGLVASVPRTATRPPAVSRPDSRRFAPLISL